MVVLLVLLALGVLGLLILVPSEINDETYRRRG